MLSNQIQSDFRFSEKLVGEIKEMYKKEHNIILSDDEAQEYINSYADFYNIIINK